jgi:NAD(P)H-dependent FMN reductase
MPNRIAGSAFRAWRWKIGPRGAAGNGEEWMSEIVGIVGSLRKKSFNRSLFLAAIELAPRGLKLTEGRIEGIPLYDADLEAVDIPVPVEALKGQIASADGLLLFTPEYNASIPGVLKNVIDWVARPPQYQERVLNGKPVGLLGATPGGMGTAYAQTAWLPVFRALGMRPWFGGSFHLSRAHKVLGEDGALVDQDVRDRLARYLADFDEFIQGD